MEQRMQKEQRNTAVSTSTTVGTAARPLRVAVVGSGPAGVYAADILTKSEAVKSGELTVSIDLFDRYPAPYGLIRYGVAPDHPRIKGIVNALHKVLDRGDIRFFGNVDYGTDLSIDDLRTHYDAVIFATGAIKDADLNIPGIELEGSLAGPTLSPGTTATRTCPATGRWRPRKSP
jgi:ferredoxin--NADP+ reductase